MEVSAEAKRIMVVALGKLYSSRTQRGGVRLHWSLLLTLVMKSARDIYHAAQTTAESVAPEREQQPRSWEEEEEEVEVEAAAEPSGAQEPRGAAASSRTCPDLSGDKEAPSGGGATLNTRKRRSNAAVEPDFLPCKKAKLELVNYSEQLLVSSALVDYVKCGSELAAAASPLHLTTAIAAC